MNVGLSFFRFSNRAMGLLFPHKTVDKASELFFTPKRHGLKAWEEDAESRGRRISLSNGSSAISWGEGGQC